MNRKSSAATAGRPGLQPQILRPTPARSTPNLLTSVVRLCRTAIVETASLTDTSRVTGILCNHCGIWVKPRRYNPVYNACTTCLPTAKAEHQAAIRAYERAHGLI